MENYIGSLCPHCGQEITASDPVTVCPACGMAHHQSCWEENQGCTTFGCPQQHYQAPAAPHARFCGKCGAPVEEAQAFCGKCGAPTDEQPAPESAPGQPQAAPKNPCPIDIKGTLLINIAPLMALIAGIVLLCIGLNTNIPSDYLSDYSVMEYVGGDAYNYIMEASLRGGRIAGAMTTKALYTAVGLLIGCISALKLRLVRTDA